jgi:hypothetical protein
VAVEGRAEVRANLFRGRKPAPFLFFTSSKVQDWIFQMSPKPNNKTIDQLWRDFIAARRRARRGDDRRNDCGGNAMNGSLELSDHQLRQIHAAAKTLLPS